MWRRPLLQAARSSSSGGHSSSLPDGCSATCRLSPTTAEISSTANFGEVVEAKGWIKRTHKTGGATFAHISDGLSHQTVQIVVPRELLTPRDGAPSFTTSLPLGSAIRVRGDWKESEGRMQTGELAASSVEVLATDKDPRYSSLTADQLRRDLSLRARSDAFSSLLRLRSRLTQATHRFFQDGNFVHVDTPILTANDCEGAGETFTLQHGPSTPSSSTADQFFGQKVFLSVSSQLHLEAVTSGISRVYTLARAFRAEKNQSSTHMSEFTMLEMELAHCTNLDEVMGVAEAYLRAMGDVLGSVEAAADAKAVDAVYGKTTQHLFNFLQSSQPIPRIPHANAIEILAKIGHSLPPSGSLSRSAELALVDHVGGPLFVTHFPSSQKPFYMRRMTKDTTESFDLLVPLVGELAGGSLRATTREELEENCPGGAIPPALEWYAALRERGKPPSGGFGIGFERLLQCLLEIKNIKDTAAFPRWLKHCQC